MLEYDPDTGIFWWRHRDDRPQKWNSRFADKKAGGSDGQYGYISIRINYQLYQAHRLAWLWMTGEWPEHMIDHINLIPTDNSWKNLRAASKSQNMRNMKAPIHNTSGIKGVTWSKRDRKWQAQIQVDGKNHYLGQFASAEEAKQAREEAATRLHGEFARTD